MSVTAVYYPSSVVVSSPATTLRAFSGARVSQQFQRISQAAGGSAGVSYQGLQAAQPMFTLTAQEVATVLGLATGNYKVLRDLSGGDVDFEFRKGTDKGTREANASGSNLRVRMQSNCLMSWSRITARQGEVAEIETNWHPCYDGSNPPMVPAAAAITGTGNVGDLYTLGPININGSQVSGNLEATLELNLEYEIIAADGESWATYVSIASLAPVLTFRNRDSSLFTTYGSGGGGVAVTSWDFYLRKRDKPGFLVADATLEHIKISGVNGIITADELSDGVECTLALEETSESFFTVSTASAIT